MTHIFRGTTEWIVLERTSKPTQFQLCAVGRAAIYQLSCPGPCIYVCVGAVISCYRHNRNNPWGFTFVCNFFQLCTKQSLMILRWKYFFFSSQCWGSEVVMMFWGLKQKHVIAGHVAMGDHCSTLYKSKQCCHFFFAVVIPPWYWHRGNCSLSEAVWSFKSIWSTLKVKHRSITHC